MRAAERLFAESGYDGTSIRAIVAKAKVNQAAINYHFDGKDGLYREVLRVAFRALTEHQLEHAEELRSMSREEALLQFVRRQLQPLLGRDEYSRHMRIFNWEAVQPTTVFRDLVAEEAAPFVGLAADLVRRFMPEAEQRTVTVAAVWLLGIIINLLTYSGFYDIALRDFGLLVGALALARLAWTYDRSWTGRHHPRAAQH